MNYDPLCPVCAKPRYTPGYFPATVPNDLLHVFRDGIDWEAMFSVQRNDPLGSPRRQWLRRWTAEVTQEKHSDCRRRVNQAKMAGAGQ